MRSRPTLVVCVLALGVLAAACGGDGGNKSGDLATSDPKAAMAAASKRTAAAKTVRIALTATSSTKVKVLEGSGSYDFTNERGRFTLKTSLGSGADMLITPTDVYVKVPKKANPTDPSWIRLTEADLTRASASGGGQFVDSIRKQVDPRSTLNALGSEVADLDNVGKATIRGVETVHLKGRVDLSDEAIAKASADKQAEMREKQKLFGADGYPLDVYLDSKGRVRRVRYEIPGAVAAATPTTTIVTFDLYDFGNAPRISLPDPADVGDSSSLTTTTVGK